MEFINAHIEFVKSQLDFQLRQAKRFVNEPRRCAMHETSAERFRLLLIDLETIRKFLQDNPHGLEVEKSPEHGRISLTWEEIEGLPPELLEELSITDSDKTEFNITSIIRDLGGVASLDRILVALYRQSGEIQKRASLNQRLYRMAQKDMIYSVPGKKGVYSTHPISEEDAAKLN